MYKDTTQEFDQALDQALGADFEVYLNQERTKLIEDAGVDFDDMLAYNVADGNRRYGPSGTLSMATENTYRDLGAIKHITAVMKNLRERYVNCFYGNRLHELILMAEENVHASEVIIDPVFYKEPTND
jgi:cell division protein ZapA (FtsZ GTPase activity inhibitor)